MSNNKSGKEELSEKEEKQSELPKPIHKRKSGGTRKERRKLNKKKKIEPRKEQLKKLKPKEKKSKPKPKQKQKPKKIIKNKSVKVHKGVIVGPDHKKRVKAAIIDVKKPEEKKNIKLCKECGRPSNKIKFIGNYDVCKGCKKKKRLRSRKLLKNKKKLRDSRKHAKQKLYRLAKLIPDPKKKRRKINEQIQAKKKREDEDKNRLIEQSKEELIQDLLDVIEEIRNGSGDEEKE